MPLTRPVAAAAATLLLFGCSGSQGSSAPAPQAAATPSAAPIPSTAPAPAATAPAASASPDPSLPPYYIESLRAGQHSGGKINVGDLMFRGAGFTKSGVSWTGGGEIMTGTISIPDGSGPFPVVIVNHGHIPVERYWIGQDSGIFGDPMASHGFISIAPNYPGYGGSGGVPAGYPDLVFTAATVMDLVGSLASLPQADPAKVAIMGHSNGGGVSQLLMVTDPRVKAAALFAPVSSDMRDNSRKWWLNSHSMGALGNPDDPAAKVAYDHISPRNYYGPSTPPAIILQGTNDEDIPAAWTQATYDSLVAKGAKTKLVWFPGAYHDMVGGDLASAVAQAEDWIRSALGA